MTRDESTSGGTVLLAFLLGAVAGAAAALLYAPAVGSETRERLAEKARDARERANALADKGRQAIDKGRQAIDEGRETITTAIERGKEAYQQARTASPEGDKPMPPAREHV
jgi:gas vesicle protein